MNFSISFLLLSFDPYQPYIASLADMEVSEDTLIVKEKVMY
jgi:hypothetical protein